VRIRKISGFTIVELLIVIVVIGILAAITIVAYSGMQTRAKIAHGQADLRAIAMQMETHKIDNGEYPTVGADLEKVLRGARIYGLTRWSAEDEIAGVQPKRSYMFCIQSDKQHYAVVAKAPIYNFTLAEQPSYTGQPLYYISSLTTGLKTIQWDSALNSGRNLCYSVGPTFYVAGSTHNVWSYDVPTQNAP
jgi:type II secretion system protein G